MTLRRRRGPSLSAAHPPRAAASLSPPSPRPRGRPRPRAGLLALRPSFATSATPSPPAPTPRPRRASPRRVARATSSARGAVVAAASFADLGLDPDVLAATDALGLVEPTDIRGRCHPARRRRRPPPRRAAHRQWKNPHVLLPSFTNPPRGGRRARAPNPNVLASSSSVPPANSRNRCAGGQGGVDHARFSSELIIGGDKFAAQRQARTDR